MVHFVECLVVALLVNLALISDSVLGATGRLSDRDVLDAIVKGAMSMMNSEEMNAMQTAEKMANMTKSERKKFKAEITELPSTVDCFGLPSWIASPIRKWFTPESRGIVNTRFYMSTRNNRERVEVPSGEEFSVSAMSGFDPRHRTVVIVHGFLAGGKEEWIVDLTNAILDQIDANVFAVDWSGGGGSWKYWKAVANTRVTGNDMTRFMEQLINEAGLRTDDLHLIGHSLGAHICGFVSRSLRNVSRITGLDPAQPCFRIKDPRMTLDFTDAKYVDVIHTNGRMLSKLGLGLPYNIGHVDFYPHGGMVQPGCQLKNTFWNSLRILHKKISEAMCSHGRAYELFTESVRKTPTCSFWGHPWDREKDNIKSSIDAKCDRTQCSEMGFRSDLYPARGSFFVMTKASSPFCVPDPRTDAEMEAPVDADDVMKAATPFARNLTMPTPSDDDSVNCVECEDNGIDYLRRLI